MHDFTSGDLITFAKQIQDAESTAWAEAEALGMDRLVSQGDAIQELRVVSVMDGRILLSYEMNSSRIRAGDLVEILTEKGAHRATIVKIDGSTRQILCVLSGLRSASQLPWNQMEKVSVRLAQVFTGDLVNACLERLVPGAPGYSWLRFLAGPHHVHTPFETGVSRFESAGKISDLLEMLQSECGQLLDDSQRQAFFSCLDRPQVLAVQGPPGTGKTQLLAIVAEGLARLGLRVVIVSPTHQSVNYALSTLSRLFPSRGVTKLGDPLRNESLHATVTQAAFFQKKTSSKKASPEGMVIVGMTAMAALGQLAIKRSPLAPNVLLVDEAGQLPLHIGAVLGLCGSGSILCFGDDKQMPPVFPEALETHFLATSTFARIRTVAPHLILSLSMTYRLNRALAHAIGITFYGHALRSHYSNADVSVLPACATNAKRSYYAEALASEHSLVWLQSPGGTFSQANPVEAMASVSLVEACLNAGMSPASLAIATPFRRHAAAIRRLLQHRLSDSATLPIIDTVERVQGLTVDLVIYSLCANDKEFVNTSAAFLFSPNRLNVAMSRARAKAILIASPQALNVDQAVLKDAAAIHFWRQLLDHAHIVILGGG